MEAYNKQLEIFRVFSQARRSGNVDGVESIDTPQQDLLMDLTPVFMSLRTVGQLIQVKPTVLSSSKILDAIRFKWMGKGHWFECYVAVLM